MFHVAAKGEIDLLLELVNVAEAAALDLLEGDGVVEDGAGGRRRMCRTAEDEPRSQRQVGILGKRGWMTVASVMW